MFSEEKRLFECPPAGEKQTNSATKRLFQGKNYNISRAETTVSCARKFWRRKTFVLKLLSLREPSLFRGGKTKVCGFENKGLWRKEQQ